MLTLARVGTTLQLATLGLALTPAAVSAAAEQQPAHAPYLLRFPDFNPNFETDAPGDVDTALEASLSKKGQFPLVQREFELYAWQLFIGLNQPSASPQEAAKSAAEARWMAWMTTEDLTEAASRRNSAVSLCQNAFPSDSSDATTKGRIRILRTVSTLSADDILGAKDFPSAFNKPLIDQHGNYVFYESIIDPNQVNYLCKSSLYQKESREKLAASSTGISFPEGTEAAPWSGSFSLKLAWKVLDTAKGDVSSRFLTSDAQVLDLSPENRVVWRHVKVGLVGMHVVHKTQSAPERIWATFEQVDNLQTDTVLHPELQPSFADPLCPLCTTNQPPEPVTSRQPTHVSRVVPVPSETEVLNQEAQSALQSRGSILQYYKLIGVQWPGIVGDADSATPSYVANVTMETFIQPHWGIDANAKTPEETGHSDFTGASCISCHAHASAVNGSLKQSKAADGRSDGDFSWFLSQRLP